jgi:predicted Zn-dependent peptidase
MKSKTLGNGLRVVVVEMPHLHSCDIGLFVKVGGINDPPGKAGISHTAEHILFRGTKDYPSPMALDSEFELIGGTGNARTDEEITHYFSRSHPDCYDRSIELFSSMIRFPLLINLRTEKRVIKNEVLDNYNEKLELINPAELAYKLAWPNHPLGESTGGTIESNRSITLRDIRRHLANFYTPDNSILVAAGNVKAESIFASAEKHFGDWRGKRTIPTPEIPTECTGPNFMFKHDDDGQSQVCFLFRSFPWGDPKTPVSKLIKYSLCGNTSKLHLNLRSEKGLVYDVGANLSTYHNTSAFCIDLSTEPRTLLKALEETLNELLAMTKVPMSDEELIRNKISYGFEFHFAKDSDSDQQMRYGHGILLNQLRTEEKDIADLKAITPEMILETARSIFHPKNLHLAVVGPKRPKINERIQQIIDSYSQKW